jgi:hypothetical protein
MSWKYSGILTKRALVIDTGGVKTESLTCSDTGPLYTTSKEFEVVVVWNREREKFDFTVPTFEKKKNK